MGAAPRKMADLWREAAADFFEKTVENDARKIFSEHNWAPEPPQEP